MWKTFLDHNWTLSLAESCTGGAISAKIVETPGASAFFQGSVVVYSNVLKQSLLQIPESLLAHEGAVSAHCAALMCTQLYKMTKTTWTGAITGIAGPSGGSPEKPVGTVFMALSFEGDEPRIEQRLFEGDRKAILGQAADGFLTFLKSYV